MPHQGAFIPLTSQSICQNLRGIRVAFLPICRLNFIERREDHDDHINGNNKRRRIVSTLAPETVLMRLGPREFSVQLWDGEQWPAKPNGPADFKLILRSPNVVRSMFSDISALSFGEFYIYGHLDIEGSLIDVFESGDRLLGLHYPTAEKLRLGRWLWSIPPPKYSRSGIFSGFGRVGVRTGERIRDAVNYHYDHPVEFWKLWLDKSLSYSCAYFQSAQASLAEAQKSKLD